MAKFVKTSKTKWTRNDGGLVGTITREVCAIALKGYRYNIKIENEGAPVYTDFAYAIGIAKTRAAKWMDAFGTTPLPDKKEMRRILHDECEVKMAISEHRGGWTLTGYTIWATAIEDVRSIARTIGWCLPGLLLRTIVHSGSPYTKIVITVDLKKEVN